MEDVFYNTTWDKDNMMYKCIKKDLMENNGIFEIKQMITKEEAFKVIELAESTGQQTYEQRRIEILNELDAEYDNFKEDKTIVKLSESGVGDIIALRRQLNKKPELFLSAILAVPFVDNLTTNMDHSLPLTPGEILEFGDAKNNKDHFEYIRSYAPYDNIEKKDYPNILITTSLSDSRVLFDEPTKYCAKLRDFKTDNNLLLFKCEMDAGHGSRSGRKNIIEDIAFDYAFALKIANKI